MREIKFRTWINSKNPWMANIVNIDFTENKIVVERTGEILDINDTSLMQYTGFRDKNHKEVYEGDIVEIGDSGEEWNSWQYSGYKAVVIWDEEYGGFLVKNAKGQTDNLADNINADFFEVIGNTYENTDLLEG